MYANFIYNSGLISFSKPLQLLLLVCCWELESDLMFETRCNQDNLMHKFPYSFLTREQRLINGNGSNVFPNEIKKPTAIDADGNLMIDDRHTDDD